MPRRGIAIGRTTGCARHDTPSGQRSEGRAQGALSGFPAGHHASRPINLQDHVGQAPTARESAANLYIVVANAQPAFHMQDVAAAFVGCRPLLGGMSLADEIGLGLFATRCDESTWLVHNYIVPPGRWRELDLGQVHQCDQHDAHKASMAGNT